VVESVSILLDKHLHHVDQARDVSPSWNPIDKQAGRSTFLGTVAT
jgi:hypothetical protein